MRRTSKQGPRLIGPPPFHKPSSIRAGLAIFGLRSDCRPPDLETLVNRLRHKLHAISRPRVQCRSRCVILEGMLNPTPAHLLVDDQNRPYFLWDSDNDLERFRALLVDPDPEVRAYYLGTLMRQAKPDDVFQFAATDTIRAAWPQLERYLAAPNASSGAGCWTNGRRWALHSSLPPPVHGHEPVIVRPPYRPAPLERHRNKLPLMVSCCNEDRRPPADRRR